MKNIIHSHHNKYNQYNLMINTKAALKQKIVISVNTDYLMGQRDCDTGFGGVSEWIMMDYLYTNYGNI